MLPVLCKWTRSRVVVVWIAVLGLAWMSHAALAGTADPLPSPLYQHSLKTSIEKFDGDNARATAPKISRERAAAAQSGGGGTLRMAGVESTVDDCWLSQSVWVLSLDPSPNGCESGEALTLLTGDPTLAPDIMRRQAPPYLPSPNPPDIPIELVQLELRGSGSFGPVIVRQSTSVPSTGAIVNVTSDPGGNLQSGTVQLDVTVEIELVALSLVSINPFPIRWEGPISALPPIGSTLATPLSFPPVPLHDINNGTQIGWICALPGYTPTDPATCPPAEQPTMVGTPSCHGSSTCPGSYTCLNATCAAVQTCQSVTCTAEPTCAGSEATCSPNPTCPMYPSCAETPTCITETCVGYSTCRGSQTCPGTTTCDQIPTYQPLASCAPYPCNTMNGPSCHGSATCPGSYTCKDASCAAFQTCVNPTCTSEPTCSPRSSTCSYSVTCAAYPSCPGTATCGESIETCIGFATCQGSSTCEGTYTCEPPAPTIAPYATCGTQPSCDGAPTCDGSVSCEGSPSCGSGYTCQGTISCDGAATCDGTPSCDNQPTCGFSCESSDCGYPTMRGFYSCDGTACPTYISSVSCAGGWLCPTFSGYNTCPVGACVTMDGTISCEGGPACITWSNYYTCHMIPCDVPPAPTYQGYETCRPAQCITWLGTPSCPGDAGCIPTVAPMASCGGLPTCAAVICIPTIPGNPTCAGVASCAPNPSCNAFGTCPGFATCAPAGTCGANTCPNFNTCAGFATCAGSVTCQGGHTCAPNVTCAGVQTCGTGSTCQGVATCDISPTCGGWPSCGQVQCLTSVGGVTCGGQATCTQAASCDAAPTCDGSPTCALAFTCSGWPTCQPPPYEIPCELKLCLDSLRLGWITDSIPPDSTQAFEWDDWHGGPIHPLLIWDETTPKIPGLFVITEWIAPPPQAGIVDTEYVRFPYWVDSLRAQDNDGDGQLSVGDHLLLQSANPAPIVGQTAWFQVAEIGKSRPQDKKYILKMKCDRPLAMACACNCHADPVCDGVINNVQDVVVAVNVAFRGAPAVPDPNPSCPYETTDVNCDGVTSVLDVVKIANVAFRGAIPAAEYCDPCP